MTTIAKIKLTQRQFASVDEELAPIIGQYKWCALWNDNARSFYSQRTDYSGSRQKGVQMHRFIWEHVNGPIPQRLQVDHINGDTLDNRLENLRVVTHRGNQHNRKERREGRTSSRYVGVYWNKKQQKWWAQIGEHGKKRHLGRFTSEEDAHRAYQKALKEVESK